MNLLVLIVEPSRTVRGHLEEVVRSLGLEPTALAGAGELLGMLHEARPGAVVLEAYSARQLGQGREAELAEALERSGAAVVVIGSGQEELLAFASLSKVSWVEQAEQVRDRLAPLVARDGAEEPLAVRQAHREREQAHREREGAPARVLAVDDSVTFRSAVRDSLVEEGCDVVLAASGEEALAALAREPFDCVLMDLTMPGLSGEETCRRIREMPARADVPLVVLTATEARDALVGALAAGADDFVSKSEDFEVLRARVRSHVRRKRLQDAHQRARDELLRVEERRRAVEERAALARELEEKQRMLDAVIHQMPLGFLLAAPDGRLSVVNARAEELGARAIAASEANGYGRSRAKTADGIPLEPADLPLSRALRGEAISSEEISVRAPDGAELVLSVSCAPVRGPRGGMLGAVAVVADVTAQKRAAEFQRQVLGLAGHDLRTPLTVVLTSAQHLERIASTEPIERVAARITSNARRAVRLVRDLLDFAQAHVGGGIAVRRREMDLHALARQVVDELGQARARVDMRMTGDATGTWDPERLAQVMFNLLDNALTHGAPGGRVQIETRGEERAVVISVHNEGAPIPAQVMPVLFEPFRRGEKPRASRESLGLGLYLVDQIVRTHGGEIEVRSVAGEGTTFTVRLPRATAHAAAEARPGG